MWVDSPFLRPKGDRTPKMGVSRWMDETRRTLRGPAVWRTAVGKLLPAVCAAGSGGNAASRQSRRPGLSASAIWVIPLQVSDGSILDCCGSPDRHWCRVVSSGKRAGFSGSARGNRHHAFSGDGIGWPFRGDGGGGGASWGDRESAWVGMRQWGVSRVNRGRVCVPGAWEAIPGLRAREASMRRQ